MKGRAHSTVFLAAIILLLASISGYSKNAGDAAKSSAQHRKIKHASQPALQLNSDRNYVIRQGDSLYRIARAFQTTVGELKTTNGLKSAKLKIGQKLRIPTAPSAVAKNETRKNAEVSSSANEPSSSQYITQARNTDQISDEEADSLRLRLVEAGFKMIGIRYRRSGGSEETGFDCSGLVKNLFSKFNIELPRSSREQYKQGEKVDRDKLEIGDLVFFSSGGSHPTHVGIYVGNDKFLHAARKARQVMVSDLNKIWYTMRYLGARRIANLWWDETDSDPEKK
jgi:cell wall-associated NlpC family hydrolase